MDISPSHPLAYLKAIVAAVGATVVPPIAAWLIAVISNGLAQTFVGPLPSDVAGAFAVLLTALVTGGAVYTVPNRQPPTGSGAAGGKP